MTCSVLKMRCVSLSVHLQGHSKKFRSSALYGEISFTVHFNDITLFLKYLYCYSSLMYTIRSLCLNMVNLTSKTNEK